MVLHTSSQRYVAAAAVGNVVMSLSSISKRYAGVQALNEVSVVIKEGSIHGLVGGNGAGKSTLIKIATGAETPDSGSVSVSDNGRGARGITAIYQELTIVPDMTVLANVFLGAPRHSYSLLSIKRMLAEFQSISARFQANIDPFVRAGSLSVADQQLVEIMRALVNRHRIIIMDEPTASLGARERQTLYRIIADLRSEGTAIVYIGHDLDEVLLLSDEVTVMRNGHLVSTRPVSQWTREGLVKAMLDITPAKHAPATTGLVDAEPVLVVKDLQLRKGASWNFTLRRGEILGIGGLVGSGRTSLLHALAGLRPSTIGTLSVEGVKSGVPRSIVAALRLGIVLTPEDRKKQGLVLGLSGKANLCLTNLKAGSRFLLVRKRRMDAISNYLADAMAFSRARLNVVSGSLSGGNQQKLVIGKWLYLRPKILLLDEPTRGIDIGAKAEIYKTIRALCSQGMSVILVSSELAELSEQCDRVILMGAGRQLGTLSDQETSVESMTELIFQSVNSNAKAVS